jgi:hypothetical protein
MSRDAFGLAAWRFAMLAIFGLVALHRLAAADESYVEREAVSGPTSLDWTFAVAEKSLPEPPAAWLPADYSALNQSYQLYVPDASQAAGNGYPLVLFVSPSQNNAGWQHWQATCRRLGCIFVGPHNAGNNTPIALRVRIVLDAFDDVRRRYPIDPDRSYIAGFSGGAHIAGQIGFNLPECFGGVMAISGSLALPEDELLGRRACDRLSASLSTGRLDPNRGMVEYLFQPILSEAGMTTRLRVFPRLGHVLPRPEQLWEVIRWHEAGVPGRRTLAGKRPTMRVPDKGAFGADERAQALLTEAEHRLAGDPSDAEAVRQLEVVAERWPETPAAVAARASVARLPAKSRQAAAEWREAERYRRHRATVVGGETFALHTKPSGKYAALREEMATSAIRYWESIRAGDNAERRAEAEKRLAALAPVQLELAPKSKPASAVPAKKR